MTLVPESLWRPIWLLGLCQCVLWGVLYYSFSVLLVPIGADLGLSRAAVSGAFSAGLGAMALAAPVVGRWLDAGHATILTRGGIGLALCGLLLVSSAHGVLMLYAGWLSIGLSMAMLLYESAFALVIRAVRDERQRMKALAAVTVLGGLASTVFLPLLSLLVELWNWRTAVLACAVAVLAVALVMDTHVLPRLTREKSDTRTKAPSAAWPPHLAKVIAIFASGTVASMVLTTLLIPLLMDRGISPPVAALTLAALGIAQLPGRAWLLRGQSRMPATALRTLPIVLQSAGLLGVVIAQPPWAVAGSVALFGLGAGLQTLARPWLVQELYGLADAGRWNGEVARVQGIARAAGPVAAAGAALLVGTPLVLAGVGGLLALTVPLARRLP